MKKGIVTISALLIAMVFLIVGCPVEVRVVSPQIVGEWRLQGPDGEVGVTNGITGKIDGRDYLFLGDLLSEDNGKLVETSIRIIDLEDPANPVEVGHLKATDNDNNNLHYIMDMELSGTVLYVLADNYLWTVDVSDPSTPRDITKLSTQCWPLQIAISGDYAYVSTWITKEVGIIVVDISDPAKPQEVGASELLPLALSGFKASGSSLFVITEDGLHIVDISSPGSLKEVSFVPNPDVAPGENQDSFQDIAVTGRYAYITSRESGLHVLDISSPDSPYEIANLDTEEIASSILVSENLAYIVDWRTLTSMEGNTTPILIIDVSNPSEPEELASVELPIRSGNFHFTEANNHIYFFGNADPFVRIVNVYAPMAN